MRFFFWNMFNKSLVTKVLVSCHCETNICKKYDFIVNMC